MRHFPRFRWREGPREWSERAAGGKGFGTGRGVCRPGKKPAAGTYPAAGATCAACGGQTVMISFSLRSRAASSSFENFSSDF